MDTETKARLRPILENSKRGKPNTKKDDDFAVRCFRKWPKDYVEFRAEIGYSHALFSGQFERAPRANDRANVQRCPFYREWSGHLRPMPCRRVHAFELDHPKTVTVFVSD